MIKALVVDDEFFGREELSGLLRETGTMDISEAKNGEEALQMVGQERFDVVFLDIDMPGINGLKAAAEIAKMESPPFVVFTTAYHQYAVEAFEANAVDYVLKPYEAERLNKTLARIKCALEGQGNNQDKLVSLEKYLASHEGSDKKKSA